MPSKSQPTNADIADLLDQIALMLEAQGENPFRVRAYREGAGMVRGSKKPIADYVQANDRRGLMALPGIGEGLANVIFQYVREGSSEVLDQLIQANQGQPSQRAPSAARKSGESSAIPITGPGQEPSVEILLDVDAEYRRKAEAEELPKIAPKRYNPENEAWLPVLRTQRETPEGHGWKFTALFSNTARAHQLEQTRDWVVIYYQPIQKGQRPSSKMASPIPATGKSAGSKDAAETTPEESGSAEQQVTIVTQHGGALDGKRVVRGRENEAQDYYRRHKSER
jgi:putative hydrolase